MPLRGPQRASHLRQVSAASIDTVSTLSGGPSTFDPLPRSVKNNNVPEKYSSSTCLYQRPATIWVHDEGFSREEVLFNANVFSESGIQIGDLVEVSRLRGSDDSGGPVHFPCHATRSVRDGLLPERRAGHIHPSGNSATFNMHSEGNSRGSAENRYLFIVKPLPPEVASRHPHLQISITNSIASAFGFENYGHVSLSVIERSRCSASHVEIVFRDQFLVRADMWRLVMSELTKKPVYKGQKILFMGTIKASIKNVYIDNKKVMSAYFGPNTIPIFRSESARYVLFIQMSREMWTFDSEGTGDILFSRVINGFLPELFKRWANIEAKHLVTLVLFTRVEYEMPQGSTTASVLSNDNLHQAQYVPTQDFYRVVVNDMASGHWTTILDELKKEFRTFLRDVSIQQVPLQTMSTTAEGVQMFEQPNTTIAGRPSSALRGNILEAINIATSHLSSEHIDRDIFRTGTSIIVISPGTGVFEVAYETLAKTTEVLTNNGIGIDLVCLSPLPLHVVPLFKYRKPTGPSSRPSSSIAKDSVAPVASSDAHLSSGSFLGRVSHLSPSANAHALSRSIGKQRHAPSKEEWEYGIPHWVEISYWNPQTQRERNKVSKKASNTPIPSTVATKPGVFVPKVRMYEIQMMGVMESEQSNISIPYLSEPGLRARKGPSSLNSNLSDAAAQSSHYLSAPSPSFRAQNTNSLRTGSYLLENSKKNTLATQAQQRKKTLSWMDEYDDAVFTPIPRERKPRKSAKSKRPLEFDPTPSRVKYSASITSGAASSKEHFDRLEDTPVSDPPSPPRHSSLVPSVSIPPASPVAKKAVKSSLKPPSKLAVPTISRSISFALRGLTGSAPRAVASTEVNAEHAKALPTSNKALNAAPASPSLSASTISLDERSPIAKEPEAAPSPISPKKTVPSLEMTPSRPISIKIAQRKVVDENVAGSQELENSYNSHKSEGSYHQGSSGNGIAHGTFAMRRGPKIDKSPGSETRGSVSRFSPSKALAPWIRSVNPAKPPKETGSRWFGLWQHVRPRLSFTEVTQWKSLKSPAIMPLTTEEFPTISELASDYLQTPYRVYQNDDPDVPETPKSRDVLLKEMIALRLSHGFQIVVGQAVAEASGQSSLETLDIFDPHFLTVDGSNIYLSMGDIIHRLICIVGGEIEVTKFIRKSLVQSIMASRKLHAPYVPAIKTILGTHYGMSPISLRAPTEEYNWNYADAYIAGHRDHLTNPSTQLRFWRTRYVLIPVHLHPHARRPVQSLSEDNEEEIHLLGINQLTHLWQRHKYAPTEKRFQSTTLKRKLQNPLNIIFQTRNPSEVVTAELDRLLLSDPGLDKQTQLLPESELFERENLDLTQFSLTLQGEKGVKMMDRRWHWRLHYDCFIGSEFTTWVVQNFRDIDTREEAVGFGNELMKHGLVQHVEERHNFRDGNYFYQIASEYRVSRPEPRSTWFQGRRSDKSVPSTPITGPVLDSPALRARGSQTPSSLATPTRPGRSKAAIALSKSMKYDLDPRKRSNRAEVIDLHYDRLHNPDNCFHIELSWMNATPKLVEDAIVSWALMAEKYGLKLVELPLAEACSITETQAFRMPYRLKLTVDPPKAPHPVTYSSTSYSQQQANADRHFYQKAVLRKFDFVLDFEASSAFPPDVDVTYSWGMADYRYSQYIHRSGCLVAQITDEGDFLLLANRLYSTRSSASKDKYDRNDVYRPRAGTLDLPDRGSPRLSPAVRAIPDMAMSSHSQVDSANLYRTPEQIKDEMEAFCKDETRLRTFYKTEVHIKPASTKPSPAMPSTLDSSIPTLELPPSVIERHNPNS